MFECSDSKGMKPTIHKKGDGSRKDSDTFISNKMSGLKILLIVFEGNQSNRPTFVVRVACCGVPSLGEDTYTKNVIKGHSLFGITQCYAFLLLLV